VWRGHSTGATRGRGGDRIPDQAAVTVPTAGLDLRIAEQVNELLLTRITATIELVQARFQDLNHLHLHYSSMHRISEDGALISIDAEFDFVACSSWECGAPADPGVSSWGRWAREKDLRVLEGTVLRSEEELAAAAIRTVIPQAQIEKLEETGVERIHDFTVTLPDNSRVAVEVTMHTDGGRRRLSAARYRPVDAGLMHDWSVQVHDQRLLNDYAGDHSFPLKEVGEIVASVLAEVEREECELDDLSRIAERCEREIDRQWRWARNELLDLSPLAVSIQRKGRDEGGEGRIDLSASTAVHHFSQVTDVSALATAIQQCIDDKLGRDQWGDADHPRWLMVVLDDGEAPTQLVGACEFEDESLDFSEIVFPGIDEVWAVAFRDETITILRCTRSDPRWRIYRNLPVDFGQDSGK